MSRGDPYGNSNVADDDAPPTMDWLQWLEVFGIVVAICVGLTTIASFILGLRKRERDRFTPVWSLIPADEQPEAELALLALLRSTGLFMCGVGFSTAGLLFAVWVYVFQATGLVADYLYAEATAMIVTGTIEMVFSGPFGNLAYRRKPKKPT